MLTRDAIKLLENPPIGYPLISAASAAMKRCGTCPGRGTRVDMLLRIAVTKYMNDPEFIRHCASLFPLPTVICGVVLKGK
jgi:hypothetical protein